MWLALTFLVIAADATSQAAPSGVAGAHLHPVSFRKSKTSCRCCSSPVLASANFVVHSQVQQPQSEDVLRVCESLCAQLQTQWLGGTRAEPWLPRCEIVLHATRESYLREVGMGAGQTRGSCLIKFDGDRIAVRRIDLLADDPARALSALAHELTHVILADRFGQPSLPRWADEGLATLADAESKRALHRRDLLSAVQIGEHMRLIDLLSVEMYPPKHQFAVFYGQSMSLAEFLVQRDEPARLVDFVEQAQELGHDLALQRVYGIRSVAELERRWTQYLANEDAATARPQNATRPVTLGDD